MERSKNKQNKPLWNCICQCGKVKEATTTQLRRGNIKSCGCLFKENREKFGLTKTHGGSNTRLHQIWRALLKRCRNPNDAAYKNYGGRGITYYLE